MELKEKVRADQLASTYQATPHAKVEDEATTKASGRTKKKERDDDE